jgi:acetylornithine deacetylase/succinyl-diaminopimelate desuccinylase-like protein
LATDLRHTIEHLTTWERPSASEGERRAAEWIAGELRELGFEASVEEGSAHGTYWWPMGLFCLLAGVAGLSGRRAFGFLAGAFSAFGIWDEAGLWRGHWTRALLPKHSTWNVVGRAGDPQAERTVLLVAHHDAAHTGLAFDFRLIRWYARTFPEKVEKGRVWPGTIRLVFLAPVLVALGSLLGLSKLRNAGTFLSFGGAASFADIGRSEVVPGANDNLTAVAAVLEVAQRLKEEPVEDIRVLLVSTGSEESFEEGMAAFVAQHEDELPRETTDIVVLDSVGSPRLILLEGEGMLTIKPYDAGLKETIASSAEDVGVPIIREHWLSFGSDALIALRRGYRTALIASFDEHKLPTNYHQPTDTADRVDYDTVAAAAKVAEATVRRLAAG